MKLDPRNNDTETLTRWSGWQSESRMVTSITTCWSTWTIPRKRINITSGWPIPVCVITVIPGWSLLFSFQHILRTYLIINGSVLMGNLQAIIGFGPIPICFWSASAAQMDADWIMKFFAPPFHQRKRPLQSPCTRAILDHFGIFWASFPNTIH